MSATVNQGTTYWATPYDTVSAGWAPTEAGCRGCGARLDENSYLCDLGTQPRANSLLTKETRDRAEYWAPLRPLICPACLLVQLPAEGLPLFSDDYPFFAGTSHTWIAHCKQFADYAIEKYKLGGTSRVVEIGSNDGTMLRRFRGKGIPALGVEPCESVAQHAIMEGIPVYKAFWSKALADQLVKTKGIPTGQSWRADLVVATNVLAHVPDLKDFLDGVERILAPGGHAVFEVAYLGDLVNRGQYDQIYHEHYSYFSLSSLSTVLARSGLDIQDVVFLPIHGGSLRVTAVHSSMSPFNDLARMLESEKHADWHSIKGLERFQDQPGGMKRAAWAEMSYYFDRLVPAKVVGYGASAKATVTLNYLGWGPEVISCVADATPAKQGKYIPGVRIPIVHPGTLQAMKPEVVVNFAWNWRKEAEANIKLACPDAEIFYLPRHLA